MVLGDLRDGSWRASSLCRSLGVLSASGQSAVARRPGGADFLTHGISSACVSWSNVGSRGEVSWHAGRAEGQGQVLPCLWWWCRWGGLGRAHPCLPPQSCHLAIMWSFTRTDWYWSFGPVSYFHSEIKLIVNIVSLQYSLKHSCLESPVKWCFPFAESGTALRIWWKSSSEKCLYLVAHMISKGSLPHPPQADP